MKLFLKEVEGTLRNRLHHPLRYHVICSTENVGNLREPSSAEIVPSVNERRRYSSLSSLFGTLKYDIREDFGYFYDCFILPPLSTHHESSTFEKSIPN